jgi:dolichol-phosphate mannosyltransferase
VSAAPELSVVVPVYEEEEAIGPVVGEILAAVGEDPDRVEILLVDDGSRDGTPAVLADLTARHPAVRVTTFAANAGQSAAMACGFRLARGRLVAALDGDGQSDPADIPRLLALLDRHEVACGIRRRRRDSLGKRWGSRFANWARRRVTGDEIVDIGCSLKAFHREPLLRIPYFDGAHRFLPVLLALEGCRIAQVEVNHRPRAAGRSKYGNLSRLARTWQDLLGVRWLQRRRLQYRIKDAT